MNVSKVAVMGVTKMSDLFSSAWFERYKEEWNKEPELSDALGKIGFSSVIGYGFDGEDKPRGFLKVENGQAVAVGASGGEDLNWDIRATAEQWQEWLQKPPGMLALGMAYTTRKIKFNMGDYAAMIKDPRMAGPFIKSFSVMGRV